MMQSNAGLGKKHYTRVNLVETYWPQFMPTVMMVEYTDLAYADSNDLQVSVWWK